MRRILAWVAALLLLLPLVLLAALLVGLNTDFGRGQLTRLAGTLTGGTVTLHGLHGRFPDRLRLDRLELSDQTGVWLVLEDAALDWSPLALIHRQALVHRLEAARVQVRRLPASGAAPSKPEPAAAPFRLPVRVTVEQLAIARAELGPALLGAEAALVLAGRADVRTLDDATLALDVHPAGGQGTYTIAAQLDAGAIAAKLHADEPAQGLLARLAALPDLGPIRLDAATTGPRNALATTLTLAAGPLSAEARGTIDLPGERAVLDVSARAPAMTPAPGVAWRSISLDAHVAGPFTAPDATGRLRIEAPAVAGASLAALDAELAGNAGQATVRATLDRLRLPGPSPDLLAASPVRIEATARLDDPVRPVRFSLDHPLLAATGTATTGGVPAATVTLRLPDLAPIGALAGIDLAGRSELTLRATTAADAATGIEVDGTVALTAAPAPALALLGDRTTLGLSARLAGQDIAISRLALDGAAVSLGASGTSRPAGLDVTAKATLKDLSRAVASLTGAATLDAHVTGPADRLAVQASLAGDVGAPGIPQAPLRLEAALTGLPAAPTGRIEGQGSFAGAPVRLALQATRGADGTLQATIERADWRSLHAEGAFTLPQGATIPTGRAALRMGGLDDLRPLLGQPIAGALTATVQVDPAAASIEAEATGAAFQGNRVGRATLKARIAEPVGQPTVAASLAADGIDAAGVTGNLRLDANGRQDALALKTAAMLRSGGTDARVEATATLDAVGRQLRLLTTQATVQNAALKPETIRLLAPATIRFADAVAVDRLRLGVRQATLDVAGRLSPTLDATIALRTPADIAAIVAPDYAADGTIALDAKLTGAPARPGGTVRLTASGLRLRTGPGRAVPPASIEATAQLGGTTARLAARIAAGSAQLTANGTAPLGAGPLNLVVAGALDLALLDPILTAGGRRARGRLSIDAAVGGTTAAPRLSGTAQLADGEVQDFGQGVRLNDLVASLRLEGDTVRLVSLSGRAGAGTITASGSVGALAPAIPVDLAIALRNARPLASDQVTADLDADLTLRGAVETGLRAGGTVTVRRAELRVPRTLPASVVTLDVRRPGQRAAAPPAAATPVVLDLSIQAPHAVYLRGRGIDAEMQGSLRIRGTSTAPQVGGGLEMRRGSISVAGTTLNFSRGKVGFDGTGVTGKIDPTLDFAADSTAGGVTATLSITGYVSKPKITLSSVPDLPQDEVLAYLIFKRSAKELGPFQVAEIAAALAELSGVGGGGGLNPLESVRKGLGLDRLSVGAGSGTSTSPTVEAGRYVANGVYVGAKQGTTGGQTQATVQIDITKGLKLETDVGSGQGGNQVGLTYQFEY